MADQAQTDAGSLAPKEAAKVIRNVHRDPGAIANYIMQRCSEFVYDQQREQFIKSFVEALVAAAAAPELPPRPPDGIGGPLVRYGIQWNGPTTPLSTPMPDGYWTPWHIAHAEIERLTGSAAVLGK